MLPRPNSLNFNKAFQKNGKWYSKSVFGSISGVLLSMWKVNFFLDLMNFEIEHFSSFSYGIALVGSPPSLKGGGLKS